MEKEVKQYYNELAKQYDADRFGNSYGNYIHKQEAVWMKRWLQKEGDGLSMGCGTGRFMEFASHGVDISESMLAEAQRKFPNKAFTRSDAGNTPLPDGEFNQIFALHVFMHLSQEQIKAIINEAHRLLKPGGTFVFDFPSQGRRRLVNHQQSGWHGATALTVNGLQKQMSEDWTLEGVGAVAFFPIHRIPRSLRPLMRPIDNLFCHSPFKKMASYTLVRFVKR